MRKARLVTIGTEITSGEVVNSNAAWVSIKLEEQGARVFSHLSVRDQKDEILRALESCDPGDLVVVTGGLGPTSDDITRECMALHCKRPLEFDTAVWEQLRSSYEKRGLPFREAHKHQCFFPQGSERLTNPAGSALGFALEQDGRHYFVLPGPPRELEAMWTAEVGKRLGHLLPKSGKEWVRWTCLGAPESEVAELVEKVIAGQSLEVGYRAQVPYVKVKLYLNLGTHAGVIKSMDQVLAPYLVGRGTQDLAEELLQRWPVPELHIHDEVTEGLLSLRLLKAKSTQIPRIGLHISAPAAGYGMFLSNKDGDLVTELRLPTGVITEQRTLPYKVPLASERGRRSAAEWAIWSCVKALRAQPATSS
jgi:nicotinamide-nucleotide amidase